MCINLLWNIVTIMNILFIKNIWVDISLEFFSLYIYFGSCVALMVLSQPDWLIDWLHYDL